MAAHVYPEHLLPTKFLPDNAIARVTPSAMALMHILFFQDHAFVGIGARIVAVLSMNPLDLLKLKFQLSTRGPERGIERVYGTHFVIYRPARDSTISWFGPECCGERG